MESKSTPTQTPTLHKVQHPRRKMQVALLAEPKTPPELRVLILAKCGGFLYTPCHEATMQV